MKQILAVVGLVLTIIIGLWQRGRQRAEYRRKQAEQAKKDLENAEKNDDPGSFLDGFGRL